MEKLIIDENSDDDALQELSAKNPNLMYLVESSGNKPLAIPGPIPTPGAAINQAGSSLIGPNNANIDKSVGENVVAIDSIIGNKETEESNEDIKVGLPVQPNIAIIALAFYGSTTAKSILVSTSPVFVSVCHPLAPVCSSKPLLTRVQLLSRVPRAISVVLSVKLFEDN